jgi:branched-chain amino acid transport system permease protein
MERDQTRVFRIVLSLALLALFFIVHENVGPGDRTVLLNIGVNVVAAVSLNLVNGFTGQFSMGHAGFMAVGAYTAAFITYTAVQSPTGPASFGAGTVGGNVLFLFSTVLGGIVAAAAGWLVGLPSLRLSGDYLAIVTLGFGEIIRVSIQNVDAVGGPRGLSGIPVHAGFKWIYFWVAVTVVVVYRLTRSSIGRAMMAVREDEIAARAMGVDTTRYKVRAFVISSFFAGVAGALAAHYLNVITPMSFTYVKSFDIITMVVLGGMGSISGSVLAAIVLSILPEALRPIRDYTGMDFRMVIYSLILITMMLTRPYGIFGPREIWDFFGFGKQAKNA